MESEKRWSRAVDLKAGRELETVDHWTTLLGDAVMVGGAVVCNLTVGTNHA